MGNPQTPHIKDSEQIILNKSFDPDFNILAVESLSYDGVNLTRTITKDLIIYWDDTTTANTTYIGKARPGTTIATALWQIKKVDNSTKNVTWADGTSDFTKTWTNRATYSYS